MSAFDTRRMQMNHGLRAPKPDLRGLRRAQRIMVLNPDGVFLNSKGYKRELELHDPVTGESWRAQHPDFPLRVDYVRATTPVPAAFIHLKCTAPTYFTNALKVGTVKLFVVADAPDHVSCAACGEEF